MKNYSEMSDFEINKAVAESIGLCVGSYKSSNNSDVYCGFDKDGTKYGWNLRDFCSNPSDAWPIIIENRIKLSPKLRVKNYNEYYKTWEASLSGRLYFEDNENPLRAAMIVYLAMRGDE